MTVRTYTDSMGDKVTVGKAHLDMAVEIKLELQNASPSRKCNWKEHQACMESEGFWDSDTNESYRCMVKAYQAEIGKLDTAKRHAEKVAVSKLDSIRKLTGDLYRERRENQLILNGINRAKRELTHVAVTAEAVRDALLDEIQIKIPEYAYGTRIQNSKNRAVVTLTDLHVGALVDNVFGNSYNYEIARKRIDAYLDRIIDHCIAFEINDVHVVGLGDMIEHVYMRDKQRDDVEFNMSQQIVKAGELILYFLTSLSGHVNVTYEAIDGNHDRMHGNKDISADSDNANYVINHMIKTVIDTSGVERIQYLENRSGTEINIELNGKKLKFVHGHLDEGNKRDRLKAYISMANDFVDCLVYGHLHSYQVEESDHGRMVVGVGSFIGRNSYSKKISCATDASQVMIVVTGDGEIIPLRIGLQVV